MSNKNPQNGNGNGYAAAAGITTADADETIVASKSVTAAHAAPPNVGDALDVKKAEARGGKRGTILKIVALVLGLFVLSGLGLFFFLGDGSGKRTVKTTVTSRASAGQPATESDDKLTAEAIAQVRSQVAPTPPAALPGATPGAAPAIIVQQPQPVVPVKVGTATLDANANNTNAAATAPVVQPADGVAGTVNANANTNTTATTPQRAGGGVGTTRAHTSGTRPSRANGQKSLVFGELDSPADEQSAASDRAAQSRTVNAGFALGTSGARLDAAAGLPARPSFGSLLPVRTLGAIYTLRTGALVRMELTRDSAGPGWKLPRRTVIVGTLRGGEFDRAYVSVVGYIDSASGRLVAFGGSLLGADAGEGMKGERRQVTSRWARIFGTIADRGFALAQTALGRRSGATIVLGDASRPEIDALTRNGDRREFVAVAAGSMGYVSVTDLPREVEGIDALAQMNPDALAQLLNSGANTGTGLTDDEVAQLLTAGSPVQIRAAIPRMNDQMRRFAEQVLNQSER